MDTLAPHVARVDGVCGMDAAWGEGTGRARRGAGEIEEGRACCVEMGMCVRGVGLVAVRHTFLWRAVIPGIVRRFGSPRK